MHPKLFGSLKREPMYQTQDMGESNPDSSRVQSSERPSMSLISLRFDYLQQTVHITHDIHNDKWESSGDQSCSGVTCKACPMEACSAVYSIHQSSVAACSIEDQTLKGLQIQEVTNYVPVKIHVPAPKPRGKKTPSMSIWICHSSPVNGVHRKLEVSQSNP